MACCRPVAGYAGGSIPEVVGPTGRMVPVGDLDGLTAVVRELVGSPALRTDLGTQGRERVAAEFNPIRSLKFVRSLYYDLVGGPVRLAPGEQHVC
jgi:glycosyltransferase involved in cell wall biosynthesis